ncbi:ribonucleoside-diphosphate reductase subunit alpha [Clostridium sp. AF19-22AC]|jgi:ribonucleoside-diphosphate reductase alpha chain|uniref:ribonucleoside-diphosphate reductase subunit alpha n=1 Tax=Clostridia TaxID=186801 RepID=UPI000E541647|nr:MULTISPECIES: ribonucleoside-diphosphate reductase subunit alpha [Clostridia]RHR30726.1 ribonucleoside-diphosphate reductase subunit alpha [Clostridium sp. AF19-22AC]
MKICKRDGTGETYCPEKIKAAIGRAFASVGSEITEEEKERILTGIEEKFPAQVISGEKILSVEEIQDMAEQTLMEGNYYKEMKSYILYREERTRRRESRLRIEAKFQDMPRLAGVLAGIQKEFPQEEYDLDRLNARFQAFLSPGLSGKEMLAVLMKAAVELTTQDAPKWEMIAARFRMLQFDLSLAEAMETANINSFYEKISWLTEEGLYGSYILKSYSKEEIDEFESWIDPRRNDLFTYSGLDLLLGRYVISSRKGSPLETPQEMFMGIAMHLAMKETNERSGWVRRFYDMLSTLKVTMATPTLSNARKPYHQLSSCFIDTVPDSLDGIYRSIDNFAKVSKFGGGMGMYFGKVRASGSAIRGFEGAAGGVIRWIRLANDTAVAVDQLGVRQGAVAVYLDVWHRDLPEFLSLRTNNGDERMKAHDVFPAVCYPDYFWKQAKEHIDGDWYLMCPHDILTVKGYALEDSFGEEWEEKYLDCVRDERIKKRVIPIKDILRLIIRSAVETGTPFAFNRDHVNRANPNSHKGIIYCSNLCTEIAQNMSAIELVEQTTQEVDGEKVVVTVTKPGEFVVCNLASLSLGNIQVENFEELSYLTESAVRALDNVIDLNFFPVPYAKINNHKYRPVGLGVSGYHHMLAKHGIKWESQEHLDFVEKVFSDIHYAAVLASTNIAEEKGSYEYFEGSAWQTGEYFRQRNLTEDRWKQLAQKVAAQGLRNGYLLATAPTSSTSIIAGTTAGLDPIMNRYFLEEKKNGLMPRVAPELSMETFWYYKNAHLIDQTWSVRACGIRQRHIDQAQSMNLYITNEYTFRGVLDLYLLAWEKGVKTIYYIRSRSLEVEECEVCSS